LATAGEVSIFGHMCLLP